MTIKRFLLRVAQTTRFELPEWLCHKRPTIQASSAMTTKPLVLTHPDNLKEIVWATRGIGE